MDDQSKIMSCVFDDPLTALLTPEPRQHCAPSLRQMDDQSKIMSCVFDDPLTALLTPEPRQHCAPSLRQMDDQSKIMSCSGTESGANTCSELTSRGLPCRVATRSPTMPTNCRLSPVRKEENANS
ncbi:hypothetical protein J6590_033714 [Homalodisca vitripennis]|nr:hypothetical protein J6590_033714 [Homalodisca vitripennis]